MVKIDILVKMTFNFRVNTNIKIDILAGEQVAPAGDVRRWGSILPSVLSTDGAIAGDGRKKQHCVCIVAKELTAKKVLGAGLLLALYK
jgi:hypothetical protein